MKIEYAVIAGKGDLPKKILSKFENNGCVVITFDHIENKFDHPSFIRFNAKLGQLESILNILKTNNVKKIIFAGDIGRPSIFDLNLDTTASKLLKRIGIFNFGKDDKVISAICEFLNEEGFDVVSPNTFLDQLSVKSGGLTNIIPTNDQYKSIQRGSEILLALAPYDIGQSVVVQDGFVLGIEATEGTQNLIKRCADFKKKGSNPILVKLFKENQNTLIDLPTIGLQTIKDLIQYKYAGVIISAYKSHFLDQKEAIDLANKNGIFICTIQ